MISLWFNFGKIMLARSRENWSKGQKLKQRPLKKGFQKMN